MSRTTTAVPPCHIRWMISEDLPQVLAIECHSFQFPWGREDFCRALGQRYCIGMVAERAGKILGYMIYELRSDRLHVANFAVHCCYRRLGVGAAMVDKLKSKLIHHRRDIMLEVRETNLPAQLFLRAQGLRCIAQMRGFYDETEEDALLFRYRRQGAV